MHACISKAMVGSRRTDKDVAAIWRELGEGYWWVLVVDDGLEAVPRLGIPDPAQTIVATGHNKCSISIEIHLHRQRCCRAESAI